MSVSHGSYHYRTDSISLSLSMNNAVSALKLISEPFPRYDSFFVNTLSLPYHFPLQKGCGQAMTWTLLQNFFMIRYSYTQPPNHLIYPFSHPQVSCPPYNVNAMTSFMRLLALPVQLLKSCVHIMALHLVLFSSYFSITALSFSPSPAPTQ